MPSIISHSEVDQFLTCERKHYYAFGKVNSAGSQGLESKHISDGLYKGNLGHAALEAYYKHLSVFINERPTDADMEAAQLRAFAVINDAIAADPEKAELCLIIYTVLTAYFDHYKEEDKDWQYLAVEMEFREEVAGDITFPFKPDLIKRHRQTGKVIVVDHKFLANLYTSREIGIQPQLPKYVGTLRNLGYTVDDGEYDLISTRVLKTKPYIAGSETLRRVPLKLTNNRIKRSLAEQHEVVRRIAFFKNETPERWGEVAMRTANSWNCKNCPFLDMCTADLNGEDTSVMAKYEFAPNSYGYDKKDEIKHVSPHAPDTIMVNILGEV